jgi:hypothetical protein
MKSFHRVSICLSREEYDFVVAQAEIMAASTWKGFLRSDYVRFLIHEKMKK